MADYPNARDCVHGSLRRSCEMCALVAEVERLRDGIRQEHRTVEFANGVDGHSPSCWVCVDDEDNLMAWPCPTAALLDDRTETDDA